MAKRPAKTKNEDVKTPEPVLSAGSIRVIAKVDGFRRAGIVHSGTKIYDPDDLTPDQIASMEGEPLLVVERIAADKTANTPTDKEGAPEDTDETDEKKSDEASDDGEAGTGHNDTDTETGGENA